MEHFLSKFHIVRFIGNWEVEVKAGREAGSVEFDVAIDESGGKTFYNNKDSITKIIS